MQLLQKLMAATAACLLVALASPARGQDVPAPEEAARFRFGPIRFTPVLNITNLGVDSNVFNEADDPKSDTTAVFGPLADYWVKLGKGRLIGQTKMDYFYFREYDTQRSFGTTNRLRLEIPLARLVPFAAGEYTNTRQRTGYEIDARARRTLVGGRAGVDLLLGGRTRLRAVAGAEQNRFSSDDTFLGETLGRRLDRDATTFGLSMRRDVTPLTTWTVEGEQQHDRFVLSPERDADGLRVVTGFEFKPFALISGKALVGYRRFDTTSRRGAGLHRPGRFRRPRIRAPCHPLYGQSRARRDVFIRGPRTVLPADRPGVHDYAAAHQPLGRRRAHSAAGARLQGGRRADGARTHGPRTTARRRRGLPRQRDYAPGARYGVRIAALADHQSQLRRLAKRLIDHLRDEDTMMKVAVALAFACVCAVAAPQPAGAQTDYVIGPQDVLTVTVYDHADLSGKFTVEADGTLTFPLIGRVKAAGLTLRSLEETLKTQFGDGFLKNPQVAVSIEEYKSQRVFVMGEVRAPGAYQLTGDMTIIEALAKAGGITQIAAEEILIVRPSMGAKAGPSRPDDSESTVLKVNVRELQAGALSQNRLLRDGDTIVVGRSQAVYVFGQVRAPGAYPIDRGTSVLQALSLAGGVTDRGSTGRIKVVRALDGKKKELKVRLTDIVEPGDTLIVGERFF